MTRALAIDLCTGLHGWSEGLCAEGYDVIGFDLEDMCGKFNIPRPPHTQLVIQDVLTLHGAQFKDAALIVASPPCQFFSYVAMPWSRAKALATEVRADPARLKKELALFDACFRIQREACAAAGRHVPMVVENVRGAIPWVGGSRWNFGSFHLWGDVPALMPPTVGRQAIKNTGGSWFAVGSPGQKETGCNPVHELAGRKSEGMNWSDRTRRGQDFTRIAGRQGMEGIKCGGDWFSPGTRSAMRQHSSASHARKAASAMIAKIPAPLSRHIAAVFRPAGPEARHG